MQSHRTESSLVAFLYVLLRDHVQPGDLEKIVQDDEQSEGEYFVLTNGYLAQYAEELAMRLTRQENPNERQSRHQPS